MLNAYHKQFLKSRSFHFFSYLYENLHFLYASTGQVFRSQYLGLQNKDWLVKGHNCAENCDIVAHFQESKVCYKVPNWRLQNCTPMSVGRTSLYEKDKTVMKNNFRDRDKNFSYVLFSTGTTSNEVQFQVFYHF